MKFFRKYNLFFFFAILFASHMQLICAVQKNKKRTTIITKIKQSFAKLLKGEWDALDGDDFMRIIGSSALVYLAYRSTSALFFENADATTNNEPVSTVEQKTNPILRRNNFRVLQRVPVPPKSKKLFDTGWCIIGSKANMKHIRVQRLRVASQRGHECAYNALKNGILVANHFSQTNENLEKDLIDNNLSDRVIDNWQHYIIACAQLKNARHRVVRANPEKQKELRVAQLVLMREKEYDHLKGEERTNMYNKIKTECEQAYDTMSPKERTKIKIPKLALVREDGQGLNSHEIEQLIAIEEGKNLSQTIVEHSIEPILINQQCGFTVYEMTLQIGADGFDLDIDQIKNRLSQDGPYTHVFIMNTANVTDNPTAYHHWITIVLHKHEDGKFEYFVMDTMPTSVLHRDNVWKLISALE